MKNTSLLLFMSSLSALFWSAEVGHTQGGLTPPGAPGPTMKTLSEVEPRIPINATNTPGDADSLFKIVAPGSYYLLTNVVGVAGKHGIEIAGHGVALDLMEFELTGAPGSMDGVRVSALSSNVVIRNGSVRGWGTDGVDAGFARHSRMENLRVSGNGGSAIRVGDNSIIRGCTVSGHGLGGLFVSFGGMIVQCTAHSNGGTGISANPGSLIVDCVASFNNSHGIAASESRITGCLSRGNNGDGIRVDGDCHVVNNTCDSNGDFGDGAGIHATVDTNRIEDNNVTDSDWGILVDGANNLIIRNSARGNGTNYVISAGNAVGQILDLTAGGTITSGNPWANFAF